MFFLERTFAAGVLTTPQVGHHYPSKLRYLDQGIAVGVYWPYRFILN